jgi:hypothetical protein
MKTADAIVSTVTGGRHLSFEQRQKGGPIVHYAFGAIMGGVYGALGYSPAATGALAPPLPERSSRERIWLRCRHCTCPAPLRTPPPAPWSHLSRLISSMAWQRRECGGWCARCCKRCRGRSAERQINRFQRCKSCTIFSAETVYNF